MSTTTAAETAAATRAAKNTARARLLLACQEVLAQALQESGSTYTQIAARLQIPTLAVARAFNVGDTLTLNFLADLLWAMDRKMDAVLMPREEGR